MNCRLWISEKKKWLGRKRKSAQNETKLNSEGTRIKASANYIEVKYLITAGGGGQSTQITKSTCHQLIKRLEDFKMVLRWQRQEKTFHEWKYVSKTQIKCYSPKTILKTSLIAAAIRCYSEVNQQQNHMLMKSHIHIHVGVRQTLIMCFGFARSGNERWWKGWISGMDEPLLFIFLFFFISRNHSTDVLLGEKKGTNVFLKVVI